MKKKLNDLTKFNNNNRINNLIKLIKEKKMKNLVKKIKKMETMMLNSRNKHQPNQIIQQEKQLKMIVTGRILNRMPMKNIREEVQDRDSNQERKIIQQILKKLKR